MLTLKTTQELNSLSLKELSAEFEIVKAEKLDIFEKVLPAYRNEYQKAVFQNLVDVDDAIKANQDAEFLNGLFS